MQDATTQVTSFFKSLQLDTVWANNSPREWAIFLGATAGGLLIGRLTGLVLRRVAKHGQKRGWVGRPQMLIDMVGPANLALLTAGLAIGAAFLKIPESSYLRKFGTGTFELLTSIAVFWYAYSLVNVIGLVVKKLHRGDDAFLDQQIVLLVTRSLRVFLVAIGVLYVAQSVFGQDVGAWLAGLGIAGLAVSLAAQDSLKHLFGSLAILLDRSFRIGDTISGGGCEGTIEDIGFRSTKVRTTTGQLATIPNSNLVNGTIVNVSRRPAICRTVTLFVPGAVSAEKLRKATAALTGIFDEEAIGGPVHPIVNGKMQMPKIYFEDILESKFKITITYWYAPQNDPGYKAHVERVNFRILEILEAVGVKLVADD
jgi:MscS family membrane protein